MKNPSPYTQTTTFVKGALWRALVATWNSNDPAHKALTNNLHRLGEALLCLQINPNGTASFHTWPDNPNKDYLILTEKAILYIHANHFPYPALFLLTKEESETLWKWISEETNLFHNPKKILLKNSPFAWTKNLTPHSKAKWLQQHSPKPCPDLHTLAKGVAALLSLETKQNGTFFLTMRHWLSHTETTDVKPSLILNGQNRESDSLIKAIKDVTNHLAQIHGLDTQTGTQWAPNQAYKQCSLHRPRLLHKTHKSAHEHLHLLEQTRNLFLSQGHTPGPHWIQ